MHCVLLLGGLSTGGGSTSIGPQRTARSSRRKGKNPYPRQEDPPAADRGRAALRVAAAQLLPPCPRGGIDWICAPTAAVWDANPLDAPQHASQLVVTRFMAILTSNLSENALLACAAQLQEGVLPMGEYQPAESLCKVVEQCAAAFKSNNASNFLIMMRLIQLRSTISR